jgi:hypothetical protein
MDPFRSPFLQYSITPILHQSGDLESSGLRRHFGKPLRTSHGGRRPRLPDKTVVQISPARRLEGEAAQLRPKSRMPDQPPSHSYFRRNSSTDRPQKTRGRVRGRRSPETAKRTHHSPLRSGSSLQNELTRRSRAGTGRARISTGRSGRKGRSFPLRQP